MKYAFKIKIGKRVFSKTMEMDDLIKMVDKMIVKERIKWQ